MFDIYTGFTIGSIKAQILLPWGAFRLTARDLLKEYIQQKA
jgi:hypothetical protein